MGELAAMARQIAERLAPAIGGTVVDGPAVGLADLRPFVQHRRRCWLASSRRRAGR